MMMSFPVVTESGERQRKSAAPGAPIELPRRRRQVDAVTRGHGRAGEKLIWTSSGQTIPIVGPPTVETAQGELETIDAFAEQRNAGSDTFAGSRRPTRSSPKLPVNGQHSAIRDVREDAWSHRQVKPLSLSNDPAAELEWDIQVVTVGLTPLELDTYGYRIGQPAVAAVLAGFHGSRMNTRIVSA
jgi:hypothetical protein